MTQPEARQQVRDVIRDKVLARWVESAYSGDAPDLPVEGDCDRIADWVMELFPSVELIQEGRYADGSWPQRAYEFPNYIDPTHTRYELSTAPEPIRAEGA